MTTMVIPHPQLSDTKMSHRKTNSSNLTDIDIEVLLCQIHGYERIYGYI